MEKSGVKSKTEELIIEAKNFFDFYKKDIGESIRKGKNTIYLDFSKLIEFSNRLAEEILTSPEEALRMVEVALEETGLVKNSRIRLINVPKTQEIKIRNMRSKNLNEIIVIEGIIRQASDVRPQVVNAKFECPSCGTVMAVLQIEKKFREPMRCACGRRGGFKLISKDLVDTQRLVVEESPESLSGGEQPKRINVFIKEDLVEPKMEEKTTPGSRVKVTGILKEVPVPLQSGGLSTRFELAIEANNIVPLEETFEELDINEEDEKQILELSQDPRVFEKLSKSIVPSIWGHEEIKRALVLQLFGGVPKVHSDGQKSRGDFHILLVGDPGVAKSATLVFMSGISPKGRYVVGKSTSGAGLCVSPNSLLMTNPGGIERIQEVAEKRMNNPKEYRPGIWKQDNIQDIKIQSMSSDMKIQSKKPNFIWKLEAPEKVIEITLSSGKKIELTNNTQLFCIKEGYTLWKKSNEIKEGDYVATPRKLIGGEINSLYSTDLIKSNPVVHNIKPKVKEMSIELANKYGDLRKASKGLGINEGNLYYNWVNKNARGNIKLDSLKKISLETSRDYREFVEEVSLYNGKRHIVPKTLTKDIFYLAGLIAGDGDIRKTPGGSFSVRFSNSNKELHEIFKKTLSERFKLRYDIQKGNEKRPEATRTNSKILAEILFGLGLCESPKSTKIEFSNNLLHVSNELLGEFIAGLFDTDGSVYQRNGKGSSCIDFTTCSEKLARQLQLVLLRYEIRSRLRKRAPSQGKIRGNHEKWVLEITGLDNFLRFKNNIPLKHPLKKGKLIEITKKEKENTNVDVIPGIGKRLKEILQKNKTSLKESGWHKNFSRKGLQRIIEKTKLSDSEIIKLAYNDIFWEKVKEIKEKKANYKFVYDLTVEDSHNFVVDGILVHNTATVVRDEYLRGWSLEAGAMVLANKGLVCLDELEKMDPNDRSAMHEAMEQQTVTVSKANVQATLRSETSVLAAANPKFGRFDPYQAIAQQIDLPPTLINRFDVIFPLRDLPDRKKDELIATHVLFAHQSKGEDMIIPKELFRKYVAYAKQKIRPELDDDAVEEIKRFYIDLRNMPVSSEGALRPIPISARQLQALIRMSEASAKMRLSLKVTSEDAKRAIEIMKYYLMQVGYDYESKTFDIDRGTGGMPTSQRSKVFLVRDTIIKLENRMGKMIPIEEIEKELEGKLTRDEINEAIIKLDTNGDTYRPKAGYVSRT